MGFGFNLFFILILVPATGILLLAWLVSRQKAFGYILFLIWGGVVGLVVFSTVMQKVFAKKILDKDDYYGQYIIDRSYFPGKQADWQYNHFRFEIKENDSIYFYVTKGNEILETYKGAVNTLKPYHSRRLEIMMEKPTHHIVSSNPTTYRSTWSFYLVFNSPKFGNMFFKKGKWKQLSQIKSPGF